MKALKKRSPAAGEAAKPGGNGIQKKSTGGCPGGQAPPRPSPLEAWRKAAGLNRSELAALAAVHIEIQREITRAIALCEAGLLPVDGKVLAAYPALAPLWECLPARGLGDLQTDQAEWIERYGHAADVYDEERRRLAGPAWNESARIDKMVAALVEQDKAKD